MKKQKKQKISRRSRGAYIIIIRLQKTQRIRIGALGNVAFKEGYYAYVGSALNGLEGRLNRHLSKDKKKHWHIDYLVERAEVEALVMADTGERIECGLAESFAGEFDRVDGFGSSDCRCIGHLFYNGNREELERMALGAIESRGMTPESKKVRGEGK